MSQRIKTYISVVTRSESNLEEVGKEFHSTTLSLDLNVFVVQIKALKNYVYTVSKEFGLLRKLSQNLTFSECSL